MPPGRLRPPHRWTAHHWMAAELFATGHRVAVAPELLCHWPAGGVAPEFDGSGADPLPFVAAKVHQLLQLDDAPPDPELLQLDDPQPCLFS